MPSLQEVLNTAYNGLMNQGYGAYDDQEEECRYRAPNGSKCAVGILIPDHLYTGAIEGTGVARADPHGTFNEQELWHILEELQLDTQEHIKLMSAMQYAHDDFVKNYPDATTEEFRREMTEEFCTIAERFGLNDPVWTPKQETVA